MADQLQNLMWTDCLEDVNSMGVRLRLYGCERMRRERMIGETFISFSCVNLELETNMWLPLEPRANITVSGLPQHYTNVTLCVSAQNNNVL